MKDVIIAIPVYRQELRWYEQLSLARCFEVLGSYPIVFIAPEGATLDYGPEYRDVPRVTFPAQYFESVDGYSALLLSTTFYQRFRDFRKLLIYQLDAFVFSDQLMDFVAMDYDWIGAPWFLGCHWDFGDWNRKLGIRKTFPVGGNGGFCLRDIQSCLRVLETYGDGSALGGNLAEDRVFCYYFHIDPAFRLAPIRVMYAFSSEFDAERVWYKNGCRLPFGCHDWTSMSATFYLWAFRQVGYDLRGKMSMLRARPCFLRNISCSTKSRSQARRIYWSISMLCCIGACSTSSRGAMARASAISRRGTASRTATASRDGQSFICKSQGRIVFVVWS